MKSTILAVAALLIASQDAGESNVQWEAPPPYEFLKGATPRRWAIWNDLPYEEISLERTPTHWPMPNYTVTFKKGGDAVFESRVSMGGLDETSVHRGRLDIRDYGKLCYLLDRMNASSWKAEYYAEVHDSAYCIVRLRKQGGGDTIAVSDYADSGPPELWAMQELIDLLADRVKWEPERPRHY